MDPQRASSLTLLFILSLISLNSKVIYGDFSVDFLDNPDNNYLRRPQDASLSPSELGATATVLLGLTPPSTLSDSSSSKLNEVLMPNPFDRPRAVLMLEVTGAEDKSPINGALRIKVVGDQRVDIQLPGEGETDVSLTSLNEVSGEAECSDDDLSDFASLLGGSYVEGVTGPLNGELTIPLADGAFLRLHMSEKADREFMTSLVSLIKNIRRAAEMHHVLTKREHSTPELITGRFLGIKALQDHYGSEEVAQSATEVVFTSISKIFNFLQAEYAGQIVGVIVHGGPHMPESENMVHVTVASRPSARYLQEAETSPDFTKIAEVLFVRTVLAWITGILLLIATILGIHFLMNMSLTKDTLLYSNVKLD